MAFDEAAADGFEIDHAAKSLEMAPRPVSKKALERRTRPGVNGPVIEGSRRARLAGCMTPPAWPTAFKYDVARDMRAVEKRHPQMARLQTGLVFLGRAQDSRADSHAFEVVDRLREHREARRRGAMRPMRQPLRLADQKFVVDPTMHGIEPPRRGVVDRDRDVWRAGLVLEILPAPTIDAEKRHSGRVR